jgi:D-alanine-D-alanine ligase
MKNKLKVGIIYGGKTFEHDVSLMTAESVFKNIDKNKFIINKIFIDKKGNFDKSLLNKIDIAFIATHGPNYEDGKIQKYLDENNIKYTGTKAYGSQINMDKIKTHDLFKKNNLNVVQYHGFVITDTERIYRYIKEIGLPIFIKPNNGGSSVGMTKIIKHDEIKNAIKNAKKYDNKIIIEKAIENPREIEVAVLGNDKLIISNPGEILSDGEFYSYESKYIKPFKTTVKPDLGRDDIKKIKDMAQKAYKVTGCCGYARVDFLLDDKNIYINEINTLPGFTKISMFPKMMEAIGIKYKDLITKIIDLALE